MFPAGLLVGRIAQGADRRLRVRLAADLGRLDYLRVLRGRPAEEIRDPGGLLVPGGAAQAPAQAPAQAADGARAAGAGAGSDG